MKKFLLLAVLIAIQTLGLKALATENHLSCTPTITTGTISPTTICAGTIISVPFTLTDCVDLSNVFTVQLSDASGSFAVPTNIGSTSGTTAGNIVAIIPPSVSFGSGYRIRVISSSPATIGTDNGVDLVLRSKPNASFSINNANQCLNSNSFVYTNTSTGSITSYSWSMGDGISTTLTNVTYSYASLGSYDVMLKAIGTNGCRDSVVKTVTLQSNPVANFTFTGPNLCASPDYIFTNTSTATNTSQWTFGDGGTSSNTNANHTFPAAGLYNVKLVIQNSSGCSDSITKPVNVLNKPTASFLPNNATQCLNSTFTFPNFSTGVGNTYYWDFGDLDTSTAINASHIYTSPGAYTVKLVATNINGCKDSTTQNVAALNTPIPDFNTNNSLCSANLSVTFSNTTSTSGNSFSWNFGDGTTSTLISPTKVYASPGTYPIKLLATNINGCKDSIIQNISVDIKPTANYTINNDTQCLSNNQFIFNNTTSGFFANAIWDFGDGTTSTNISPTKIYSVAGIYNVKLIVVNATNCKDSVTQTVTVVANPVPKFTVSGNTSCSSTLNISFNNTTTGTGNSYLWLFGDGTTSTLTSPSKTYAAAGFYIIRLIVTNATGCKDSTEHSVTFATKPTAGFTINNSTQCINSNTFTFTNNSVGATSYAWDFGDGITSTLTNPSKGYSVPGNYVVKFIVTSANGCKDSATQTITVYAKPVASFTTIGTTSCSNNLTITTSNTSTGIANSYVWDFGDGSTSTLTSPSKTYAVAGTYIIKLVVTNGNGCKDSISHTITFTTKPTSNFTINNASQCINTNNFTFTNISIGASGYAWDFGDGVTSALANPSKAYAAAGNYTVKLISTNGNGCSDTMVQIISVLAKPSAAFSTTGNTLCTTNLTIATINTSTGVGNTYVWDFGDGSSSVLTNPSKTYGTTGSYIIKLIATNVTGCKDSTLQSITFSAKPTAGFTTNNNAQCVNSNNFTFTNTSVGATTYSWNFGDGVTSTLTNPSKSYSVAGTYTITLIATSANGCKDTTTQTITVLTKPTASFTLIGATNCTTNTSFTTTNTSTGVGNSYFWNFGDGSSSSQMNPSYTYASAGSYIVKLITTNGSGCKDSTLQNITFSSNPTAAFTVNNNTSQCINNNSFSFTNNSVGSSSYFWDFGDANTSTLVNPTKVYTTTGTYNVKLIVTTTNGCKDSITKVINVIAKPTASFTVVGAIACTSNLTISLNNTSTGVATNAWDFGDGTTSTVANPSKVYASIGTYIIKLVVTNGSGCKDSTLQSATFSTKPTAGFTVNNVAQCLSGNSFSFTNTTINATSYSWTFGDGTTSLLTNPVKVYSTAGTYTVQLIAASTSGCNDTTTQTITVTAKPTASFTIPNYDACNNSKTLSFTNTSTNATSYVWDFGDGATSSATSTTHSYTFLGTYIVKLFATNASGCVDSTQQTVSIVSKPTAAYTYSTTGLCTNNTFSFADASIVTLPASYYWDFGDGTFSLLQNPTKAFSTAGTFKVLLFVTNANGCKDSTSKLITIVAKPTASFTIPSYNACSNTNTFSFTNTSTLTTSYVWDFGDGTGSTSASPTKTYTTQGTYIVKLFATNASGCVDSTQQTISLVPKPTAAYTYSTTGLCTNNTFTFVDASTVTSPASYYWDFGDGTFSLLQNPTKAFSAAGTYKVLLFVTNANGCKDSTSKLISIVAKPTASFTIPSYNACSNTNTFSFTNTSTLTTSYVWDFGDGTGSTSASPTKTYTTQGTYIVKLFATNASGCVDSTQQTISLVPKPTAAYTYSTTGLCTNNTFTFVDASTVTSPASYYWDFGDGTFSLLQNPTKAFSAAGTYKVLLFVTNANGCKDSTSKLISIVAKPTASFTIPNYNACSNTNTFSFTNTSTGAVSYLWDFGDGTGSTSVSPTKTYTTQGTYIVKLVVTNTNGCVDSSSQTILLIPKPIAAYTYSTTGLCTNNTFSFIDASTITSTPSYYYWDFGDGTFSLLQNPVKAFSAAGTYKVLLFVTNGNGCKDSTSKLITIVAKPTASFTVPNYNSCSNTNTFSFINTSIGATSYVWDFGDGTGSTSVSPTKTYATQGTYIVRLVVTNANGCVDSSSKTISLVPKPIAAYTYSTTGLCTNNTFSFVDASTITATPGYYYWDFGDGTFSLLQNPVKAFSAAGTYKVLLFVTNANGCKDSTSKLITVATKPSAAFTITGSTTCTNNLTITFNNKSGTTNNFWDFGDGTSSTAFSPTKTYTAFGTYMITLIVTNANGCTDSISHTITLQPKPTAAFSVNNLSSCLNNNFVFSNTSVNATSYFWDFGDGSVSTLQNPSKSYTTAGTYTVSLTVTGSNGCTDVTTKTVTAIVKPTASFSLLNFSPCSNNFTITTVNTSTGATNYFWDFGDGILTNQTNITKTFAGIGTYTIMLIATNTNGCTDTAKQTISFINKPTASFAVSSTSQCLTSNSFSFANSSTGNISGFAWDFGDGTSSTLLNPTKSYLAAGTYTVKLTVTNSNGCTDIASQTLTVTGKPVISYSINNATQCIYGNVFTFTNTSPNQTGISYYWNFGDGILSSLSTINKSFAFVGTYSVSLIATNGNGCTDSLVKTVSVIGKPTAAFSASVTSQCANNAVLFTNNSIATNASYTWSFGDGSYSNAVSPAHSYAVAGSYTVNLIASNSGGCIDSISQTILITAKPVAAFTISGNNQCSNNNVISFTNTTAGNISYYLWTFSDGTVSNDFNPVKTFANAGTYAAKLLIVSSNGCRDSLTRSFTILPKTVASFGINAITQCVNNNSFVFTNTSNNSGLYSFTYKWDLGDGTTASTSIVTKSYLTAGTYLVKLVAINNTLGCSDSLIAAVTVIPQPTASLVGSGTICEGNSFVINTNLSGTPPFSFVYNDGTSNHTVAGITTSTYGLGVSPTITTTYRIIAMNDAYCSASTADVASTSSTVTVNNVSFTTQPANVVACVGSSATLTATATASTVFTYQWQKNGVNIPGATNNTLTLTNITTQDSGIYRLALVLPCGTVYSDTTFLAVAAPALPPVYQAVVTLCQFDSAAALTATGTTLHWYTTATGGLPSLVPPIPNTLVIGSQQYWVSNSTSLNCESPRYLITVNILPAPTVTAVALGRTVLLPNQTVTLQATASANSLGVRWYYNGKNIGSTPNNLLTVGFNNLGVYQAEAVTSSGCAVRSQPIEVSAPRGLAPASEGINLNLYPNPATSLINLYFDNPTNMNGMVRLVNMSGQILQSKPVKYVNRFQPVQLNVSVLPIGTYAIEVLDSYGYTLARNLFVKAR